MENQNIAFAIIDYHGVIIRFQEKDTLVKSSEQLLDVLKVLETSGVQFIVEEDSNWKQYPQVSIQDFIKFVYFLKDDSHPPTYQTAFEYITHTQNS